MFNRTAEWFGHLAVQMGLVVLFTTFLQSGYAFEGGTPAARPAPRAIPRPGKPAPALNPMAPSRSRIAPAIDPMRSALGPLLAQASPTSMQLANMNTPQPVRGKQKPHNETVPAAAGARPSGLSVKASRFHPRTQSADDPTDPYIVAQAAALNNNATQIFNFVRDQIGFQVYSGSLRGARGTLWSGAGNSLDRASLLIALLGAAGVTAQYVEGTLPQALQQQLILSMFPNVYQVAGCQPPSSPMSNPASDPTLLGIVSDHFWVEIGPSSTPADPSFPGATIGNVNGTPTNTFTTIPASLQHTVTFRLDIEEYEQASALLGAGDGIYTTEVINQTFATTDLVGVPVTVGNFVSGSSESAVFSATTFTYSPYLRLGLDPTNPSGDETIAGQGYQETYTSFPLGTEVLTGVFLYMDVSDPGSATETYERTIVDRIGYAARQSGAAVSVSTPNPPAPALLDVNLVTVHASSSALSSGYLSAFQSSAASLDAQRTQALAAAQAAGASVSPQSSATAQQVMDSMRELITMLGAFTTSKFISLSDPLTQSDASGFDVVSYLNSPRLITFVSGPTGNLSASPVNYSFALDLRKDDINTVAPPGQATVATFAFNSHRGIRENEQEYGLMTELAPLLPGQPAVESIAISLLFAAASQQGIPAIYIDQSNIGAVSSLPISADAQARITSAVTGGLAVFAPTAPVMLNGAPQFAWVQLDPATGQTQDTTPDGGHQAIVNYAVLAGAAALYSALILGPDSPIAQFFLGFLAGFIVGILLTSLFLFISFSLPGGLSASVTMSTLFQQAIGIVTGFAGSIVGFLTNATPAFKIGFIIGLAAGVAATFLLPLGALAVRDGNPNPSRRPSDDFSSRGMPASDPLEPPFAIEAVGPSAAVAASLTFAAVGEAFTGGLTLPLAFTAVFPNSTASPQTYSISASPLSGFTLAPSLPSIMVPPGKSGQIDVCVIPNGQIPPAGQPETLSMTATGGPSPITVNANFTVPSIPAIILGASPAALTTTAGQSVSTTLTIQSVGNVNDSETLTASVPAGLTLSGLNTNLNIPAGQTSTQTLNFTPSGSTAPGTQFSVILTSSSSGAATTIPVLVESAQAQSAAQASQSATALGRPDIATTLTGLAGAINTAISSCSAASQQSVVDYVNNLIQEMNAPFLANFVSQLQSAGSAISAATCANLGTALTNLSTILASLNTVLQSPAAFPFNLALQPNSSIAQPNLASNFLVVLQNNSTTTNTYTLTLGQLPASATGSLSVSSVTLAPGASIPVNNASNNPTVTITQPTSTAFQFSLSASINGVSGSTQTAYGTLTARNTFLSIQDVIATPGFTNAGGSVDVVTDIANVVNQTKTVQVTLVVNNSSSQQVLGPFTQTAVLSVTSLLTRVDFGQINTTGLANGNYTLAVSVIDPTTNTVIPGGTGTGNLLIGSPVTATLTATPTTLAPGNGTVTSTLAVSGSSSGTGSLIPIGSPLTFGGTNAPDTYSANTTFGPTPVLVDNGNVTIWQQQVPTGPNGEWDVFYMQTTAGGPLAGDINGYWNIVMDYQLSAAVVFDQVVSQWLVNGTPVSPLTNGIGSICCASATNPILPGEAYYNYGFSGDLPAGTQTNWQEIYVTPYSYVESGGINPNTANEFIFALHFTRQSSGTGLVQYTATVQVPNTGKVIYDPSSFSIAPTITPGTGSDTLTWTNPSSNTITWTSNVTGLSPADVLPVADGGTVNFTVTAGSGSVTLPQVNINSGQILGLTPATETVAPGQLASYTLTVNNPSSSAVTYSLAATGVNPAWVTLQPSVSVPASGSVTVPLGLRSALADIAGTYGFTVTATAGATSGSVQGSLILQGTGTIGATASTNALGASVTLTPTQATGGQGTPTRFTVQVTNAGSVADTYTLTATTPSGIAANFALPALTVQPGLSNFQQTILTLTPAPGTPSGPANFTVIATSQTNPQVQSQAAGTLNVVSTGVTLNLSPASVNPGGSFQLTVHNTGQTQATFALALDGPAAVISKLATSSVTLAPGQSQNVAVAVGAAPFAVLGSLGLVATATANGVTGSAAATVIIPSTQSVSAAFTPATTNLSEPGPVNLLLQVQNTGTLQDTYTASIVSTNGPVEANLVNTTGNSVQTTSPFILPGVTTGALALNATLTGKTSASITVKITSQTNPSITALATGILSIGADIPVAIAGKNRNVRTGKYASLDGGQSYDPDENELTYAWTIVSMPSGSSLTSLENGSTPQPDFLADVSGVYTFQLIVNNGTASSAPSTVTITAGTASLPPDANAGLPLNALVGSPVTLNGTASSDPNQSGTTLNYSWMIQSAPAGSSLAGVLFGGTSTPSFTPDVAGAYSVLLTVNDNYGSGTDTVIVTAYSAPAAPNAIAGVNRRILLGTPVTVDGSASYNPGSSTALTYQWSFVSGGLADSSLTNANTSKVTFTPPLRGFFVTRLDANNGALASFGETTVMAANFCDANADGVVNQTDFDLIAALEGTVAQANDPLDVNGDGMITAADLAICQSNPGGAGGTTALAIQPSYMTFSYTIGGAVPAAQKFGVTANTGAVTALLSAPNAPWIEVSPSSGSTPVAGTVSINPIGLVPGTYQGLVYAGSLSAYNLPTMVVTLTVYAAPQFILLPSSMSFTWQAGQSVPPPQTLELESSGQIVNFTSAISSGVSWLQVQPSSGTTPLPLAISVSPQGLTAGTYNATITFSSPSAPSATFPVTLVVTPAPPTIMPSGVVNAASQIAGSIAPGEMLNISGTGFAPPGPATSAPVGQPLPNELGQTQVFFDEVAAPISWVQSTGANVIVPFEMQGRTSVLLKVVNGGTPSSTISLAVVPTAPGIFTAPPATGVGQIAALNQDTTANSAGNPAARGSIITFYATGAGQTNPAGVDGVIPGQPLPSPVAPVTVTIGGVQAQVTFAGDAPGSPEGLMQINAIIPTSIPANVSTPVVLTVGSVSTQASTTIAIR